MNDSVVLVDGGIGRFALAVDPPSDGRYLREPIEDLVHYLERCLGRPVVWATGDRHAGVTLSLEYRPLGDLKPQEFMVEANASGVRLIGGDARSVGYAVSWFLEEYFKVRWLWPGASGEVVTIADRVVVPAGRRRHRPDFLWRQQGLGGAFWEKWDAELGARIHSGVGVQTARELETWHRRMRMGGLNIADGHRWVEICSPLKYGQERPEYFALVNGQRDAAFKNGKHDNQPCTSNPRVVRLTADYVIEQFRRRPDLDGFSIALNDGLGHCECEACRRLDGDGTDDAVYVQACTATDAPVREWLGDHPARPIADRVIQFANEVAELVAQRYDSKLLLMLAYGPYRSPPRRVVPHRNVMVQFCSMSWSWADPRLWQEEADVLRRMAQTTRHLGFYDYLANGSNGSMPRGYARTLHRVIRFLHETGGRYYATQPGCDFALAGFAYFLLARVLWDVHCEFDKVLDDFCRSGFGPAAGCVRRYLLAWCDRWERTRGGRLLDAVIMERQVAALYPLDWRSQRRDELHQALALAGDDEAIRTRVAFLMQGLDFTDRLADAADAVVALVEAGLDPSNGEATQVVRRWLASGPGRAEQIQSALRQRDRLLAWVDARRNQFIIAEMWFDYQRLFRGGLLGPWLDRIAAAQGLGQPDPAIAADEHR